MATEEEIKQAKLKIERASELTTQATKLAVELELYELEGGWNVDELLDLEDKLRRQLKAVRRILRRWNNWESACIAHRDLTEGKPDVEWYKKVKDE